MKRTQVKEVESVVEYEFARHSDDRGYFQEIYGKNNLEAFAALQINLSQSEKNIIRGLHVAPFAKLVTCVLGRLFDVVVDVREGSPTEGNWYGTWLTEWNLKQLYIPKDCAHGFFSESDKTHLLYAQYGHYDPKKEFEILWDDPEIGIDWPPASKYILSDKDKNAPTWKELRDEDSDSERPSGDKDEETDA